MKVYYSVFEKFNIVMMSKEHKDILLGEALSKLEVIKNLIDGEANETYRTIDVKTLQAVLGYYPEALKAKRKPNNPSSRICKNNMERNFD